MSSPESPWRTQTPESTGLARYFQTIRAHIRFVAACVIISLAAATLYLARTDDVYEAHAQVLVQPVPSDATTQLGLGLLRETGDPTRPLETLARIVTTNALGERVIKELKLQDSPRDLLLRVQAAPVAQSNIVDIAARAPTPQEAQRIANAFGQGIVDDRTERLHQELDAVIPRVRAQVSSLSAAALAQPGSPLEQLRELQTLREGADPTVRLETPATLPTSPVEPRPLLTMIAALLGGLVVGIGGAFLLQLLDPRLRRESQLRDSYRLPIVARVPDPERGAKGQRSGEFSRESFNIYRPLRVALDDAEPGGGARMVLLTAPPHPSGTSSTAAGLAWSLARGGERVLLIAADTTQRPLADAFKVKEPRSGFAEVLAGTAELREAVVRVGEGDGLLVMPAGDVRDVPDAAFGHAAAQRFAEDVGGPFDWVIVDAPPLDRVGDLLSVADRADDVLVVVRPGESRLRDIEALTEALEEHRIQPRGFIVAGG